MTNSSYAGPGPLGVSVGEALIITGLNGDPGSIASVQAAIQAINRVHGDGTLPNIEVVWDRDPDRHGHYFPFIPRQIGIHEQCPHIELTICHEVGHFIDNLGSWQFSRWASKTHRDLKLWRRAVQDSPSVTDLRRLYQAGQVIIRRSPDDELVYSVDRKYLKYLWSSEELFARSYAQYIAVKSKDPALLRQVDDLRDRSKALLYYPRQWDAEEFGAIEESLDVFMSKRGWRG